MMIKQLAGDSLSRKEQIDLLIRGYSPHALASELLAMQYEADQFRAALKSIAANTCCDSCREAALVARAALRGTS